MMAGEDVAHGVTVRNYIALEVPSPAKSVLQQKLTRARRLTVDRVVSAHNRPGLALNDGRAKRR